MCARFSDPYCDRRAPDGGLSSGWRRVRRGGSVKFAGAYYSAPELARIVGELVSVNMGEYWGSYVIVSRGAVGCNGYFCRAVRRDTDDDRVKIALP